MVSAAMLEIAVFATRCYASVDYAVMGVYASVTFIHSVKTNKHSSSKCNTLSCDEP